MLVEADRSNEYATSVLENFGFLIEVRNSKNDFCDAGLRCISLKIGAQQTRRERQVEALAPIQKAKPFSN